MAAICVRHSQSTRPICACVCVFTCELTPYCSIRTHDGQLKTAILKFPEYSLYLYVHTYPTWKKCVLAQNLWIIDMLHFTALVAHSKKCASCAEWATFVGTPTVNCTIALHFESSNGISFVCVHLYTASHKRGQPRFSRTLHVRF